MKCQPEAFGAVRRSGTGEPGARPGRAGPDIVTQAGQGTVNSVASGLWLGQAQTQRPDVPAVQPPEQAVTVTVVTRTPIPIPGPVFSSFAAAAQRLPRRRVLMARGQRPTVTEGAMGMAGRLP